MCVFVTSADSLVDRKLFAALTRLLLLKRLKGKTLEAQALDRRRFVHCRLSPNGAPQTAFRVGMAAFEVGFSK